MAGLLINYGKYIAARFQDTEYISNGKQTRADLDNSPEIHKLRPEIVEGLE